MRGTERGGGSERRDAAEVRGGDAAEGEGEVRVSLAGTEERRVNLHVAGGVRVGRADAALSEQPNEEAAASTERTNERTTALAARGQYYHDTDTGHFIIRADAPHDVGDELHICYSTANSQDTLSAYGFVEGWGDGEGGRGGRPLTGLEGSLWEEAGEENDQEHAHDHDQTGTIPDDGGIAIPLFDPRYLWQRQQREAGRGQEGRGGQGGEAGGGGTYSASTEVRGGGEHVHSFGGGEMMKSSQRRRHRSSSSSIGSGRGRRSGGGGGGGGGDNEHFDDNVYLGNDQVNDGTDDDDIDDASSTHSGGGFLGPSLLCTALHGACPTRSRRYALLAEVAVKHGLHVGGGGLIIDQRHATFVSTAPAEQGDKDDLFWGKEAKTPQDGGGDDAGGRTTASEADVETAGMEGAAGEETNVDSRRRKREFAMVVWLARASNAALETALSLPNRRSFLQRFGRGIAALLLGEFDLLFHATCMVIEWLAAQDHYGRGYAMHEQAGGGGGGGTTAKGEAESQCARAVLMGTGTPTGDDGQLDEQLDERHRRCYALRLVARQVDSAHGFVRHIMSGATTGEADGSGEFGARYCAFHGAHCDVYRGLLGLGAEEGMDGDQW